MGQESHGLEIIATCTQSGELWELELRGIGVTIVDKGDGSI
jgi:hypothetical protein